MSETYTPEPWSFHQAAPGYPGDQHVIIGQNRKLAWMPRAGNPKERAEFLANFRRIAACVNACSIDS